MATSNADARQQILDAIGEAVDDLAFALASLGEAYDQLDETSGDRMEAALFRPVQFAYGRGQKAHADFAGRHAIAPRSFEPGSAPVATSGPRGAIDAAVDAVREADGRLSELQDSLLPIEFGDPELRAALEEVRSTLGDVPGRAREFTRTLGR